MPVIKLRGLPWSCTSDQIVAFLEGIKIVFKSADELGHHENNYETSESNNNTDMNSKPKPAIYLTANAEGRPSGEAFVELLDEDDLEVALKRNNHLMGQRYIEIFRSDYMQLNKHIQESISNTSNWVDPVVRLRGLPYGCTKHDIANFFDGKFLFNFKIISCV